MGWEDEAHREAAERRRRAREQLRDLGFAPPEQRHPVRTHRPVGLRAARSHPDLYQAAHERPDPDAPVRRGALETGPMGAESAAPEMPVAFAPIGIVVEGDFQHSAIDLWCASIWGEEPRHLSGEELEWQRGILITTVIIATMLLQMHMAVGWVVGSGRGARELARWAPRFLARLGPEAARDIAAILRVVKARSAIAAIGSDLVGRGVGYLLGDLGENVRGETVRLVRSWGYPELAELLQENFTQVDVVLDRISPIRTFCEDRGFDLSGDWVRELADLLDPQAD